MQRISLTPFGRQPVSAGLLATRARLASTPDLPTVDKWALLNDLRTARMAYGITDRDLVVLHALVSFLPGKDLADGPALMVFPSNASLSDRAHGMPESTLRRHLAALVRAGLLARHDSPNGKRYATRDLSGELLEAYGFDLRPLLARAEEIADRARTQREAEAHLRRRRTHLVIRLRDAAKLADYAVECGLPVDGLLERIATVSRVLRRKMDLAQVDALLDAVGDILSDLNRRLPSVSMGMGGNDSLIERHHSNSNTDSLDFEPCLEEGRGAAGSPDGSDAAPDDADSPERAGTGATGAPPPIPLVLVLKACPDLALYAPDPIRSWRDLVNTAHALRPMIGISPSAWDEALTIMGPENAALALSGILQRFSSIRNPGGYLRALSRQAAEGRFSPGPMLMALLNTAGQRAA